jgi:hypothetical protein
MFSIIFCFLPILFMIFQFYLLKSRNSVTWEIKKGQICHNCKVDLNISEKDKFGRMMKSEDFSKLCITCNRDQKISGLKNPLLRWRFKIQKRMISDKFDKLYWFFTPVVFLVIITDLILMFYKIRLNLWIVYGSINFIWWILMIWKSLYTTQKKPSE